MRTMNLYFTNHEDKFQRTGKYLIRYLYLGALIINFKEIGAALNIVRKKIQHTFCIFSGEFK